MGKHEIGAPRRAVFLDRDGVINAPVVRDGKPFPPAGPEDFSILEGVREACNLLRQAGYLLVVVTNQPDVGRGTQSAGAVEAMHAIMCAALPIDRVEVCFDPHDSPDTTRRKPKPGMILDAARELGVDPGSSYMVGDRWRDIDCGAAAGCTTVFIDYGYDEELRTRPHLTASSLLDAAERIVAQNRRAETFTESENKWQPL